MSLNGPPSRAGRVDWLELYERIRHCRAALCPVQLRLGTEHERVTDFEDSVRLGHELANLLVPFRLRQDLPAAGGDEPPSSPPS